MLPLSISQSAPSTACRTAASTRATSGPVSAGPTSFRFTVSPCLSVIVRLVRIGFLNRHQYGGVAAVSQQGFQPLAAGAAGNQHRPRFAAERVDHARRVEATPSGRFPDGIDVSAVFERQPVDAKNAVDGRIDGERDDQKSIVPSPRRNARISASASRPAASCWAGAAFAARRVPVSTAFSPFDTSVVSDFALQTSAMPRQSRRASPGTRIANPATVSGSRFTKEKPKCLSSSTCSKRSASRPSPRPPACCFTIFFACTSGRTRPSAPSRRRWPNRFGGRLPAA